MIDHWYAGLFAIYLACLFEANGNGLFYRFVSAVLCLGVRHGLDLLVADRSANCGCVATPLLAIVSFSLAVLLIHSVVPTWQTDAALLPRLLSSHSRYIAEQVPGPRLRHRSKTSAPVDTFILRRWHLSKCLVATTSITCRTCQPTITNNRPIRTPDKNPMGRTSRYLWTVFQAGLLRHVEVPPKN